MKWSDRLFRKLFPNEEPKFLKFRSAVANRDYFEATRSVLKNMKAEESNEPLGPSETVVVVGLGVAALTAARELRSMGHRHVTLISADLLYGGKCVNYGCMPSEFVFSQSVWSDADTRTAERSAFVDRLRLLTRAQFEQLGYPVVQGRVREVSGKNLVVERESGVEDFVFDRLIWAAGNKLVPRLAWKDSISFQDVWDLRPSRILILSQGSPTALSLAELAFELGHQVTVVEESTCPLARLPSYRYYQRAVEERGVRLLVRAAIQARLGATVEVRSAGKVTSVEFDSVLDLGRLEPNLPTLVGKKLSLYDIDLRTGALPDRNDIVFIGDAGGTLSALEAELQARRLVRRLILGGTGERPNLGMAPLRFHGRRSWAAVGAPWTMAASGWREVDFQNLGWTAIHREPGKAWYLFDPESGKVLAVQICHAQASELIALAAGLMEFPVTDWRWWTVSVHPSAAEIFKIIAGDALAALRRAEESDKRSLTQGGHCYELVSMEDVLAWRSAGVLPEWITTAQVADLALATDPRPLLSALFALSKWRGPDAGAFDVGISHLSEGGHAVVDRKTGKDLGVSLQFDRDAKRVRVCMGEETMEFLVNW